MEAMVEAMTMQELCKEIGGKHLGLGLTPRFSRESRESRDIESDGGLPSIDELKPGWSLNST